MNRLRFPVSAVGEDGLAVDLLMPVSAVQPADAPKAPLDTVQVKGFLTPIDDTDILFQGRLNSELTQACDRCLAETQYPVSVEVTWLFRESASGTPARRADADDEEADSAAEVFAVHNGEIDMTAQVWEELVLAVPHKVVCRPDCKGLCPRCGRNLNEASCGCKQEETPDPSDNGLGALAQMFPEWVRKKPEE